jgi:hypothetical protein
MYRNKVNPKTKEYQVDPKHVHEVKGGTEQSGSRGDEDVDTTPLSPAARHGFSTSYPWDMQIMQWVAS